MTTEKKFDRKFLERIEKDLVVLVDRTLEDKEVGPRIIKMLESYKLSAGDLKKEVLSYTIDKADSGYDNKRYQRVLARQALFFHNLVQGTYHKKRHNLVLQFLREINAKKLMDVGYGVPGPSVIDYLKENKNAEIILADQDPTAEDFARTVISNEAPEIMPRVNFKVYDMDSEDYPGTADVYLYLDSMEHTKNPTRYLKKFVDSIGLESHIIFSIPICSMKGLEGFHYMEWLTDASARTWLREGGLNVIKEGTAHPNPNIDYFAELCEGGYHNYLALCKK